MSPIKKWTLFLLVTLALFQAGVGGLRDMFGVDLFGISSQHGWHDAIILLLLAILVAITVQ
jgi:hypothetical protein